MRKIKEMYRYNSIVQFIVQYVLILLLPLLICTIGAQISFSVLEEYVKNSNMYVINHSKSMIDSHLKQIHTLALQIARNEKIQKVAEYEGVYTTDYYLDAKEAIEQIQHITKFKNTDFLKSVAVYYEKTNYYMVDSTIYNDVFYLNYVLKESNFSIKDFKDLYGHPDYSKSFYRFYNGAIQWVQPIIGEDGLPLSGVVICTLDMSYLNNLFLEEDNTNTKLFIQEEDGTVLYQVNTEEDILEITSLQLDQKQGYMDLGSDMLIYTTSDLDEWKYIMVVEEKQVMAHLNKLKSKEYMLILLALGIGIGLACFASIKQGKPINEIFNVYIPNQEMDRNFKNLGGVVSEIVTDHRQMMEEIEKEKPLLRYAFLYKLVRGQFSSKKELIMLAQKVDCHVDAKNYRILAVRLFGNNDFYDADAQTLEEVQIIFHYLQAKLRYYLKENVWFYENDYLTQIIILPCVDEEQKPEEVIDYIREELVKAYKVNPSWGVSGNCTDVLELWRACEEAKAALSFATENSNIVYYSDIMTEQKGYYYPELFEERLVNSVNSGDVMQIKTLLDLSKKENFELRKLSRSKFLKLNNRFINTIVGLKKSELILKRMTELNDFVIQESGKPVEIYYEKLYEIFESISTEVLEVKISKRSRLTDKIKEYVHQNYDDSNLGLSMVATEFNVSEGYVSTLFKDQVGVNFSDYVEKLRMEEACNQLQESQISISQIAEEVGYNSIQSFRRAFKKVKGVSPSKFREDGIL
jgi:AraC-like DNA-binding protein